MGDLDIAADQVGDAHHIVVMGTDDLREGGLIACRCLFNDIDAERPTGDGGHTV